MVEEKIKRRSKMKKIVLILSFILGLSVSCFPVVFGESSIKVTVNGTNLVMNESPVIINGRTLVPLRSIFEALGVTPIWDGNTKTVSAKTSTVDMSLIIGGNTAMVNNRLVLLEAPGTLVNGSTMVPARFIAETFGAKVDWESETKTVLINMETNAEPADNATTQGTLTYANGDKYVGSIKEGIPSGKGSMVYADGSEYVGDWSEGKSAGQGKFTMPNFGEYIGEFKNGNFEGQGSMTFAIGIKYVGGWKNGKSEGQGTETYRDGTVRSGIWANGELVKED